MHVSRRYFLANTAAAGAAIGALARPDIARATVHPDTELLRLGEELKVLLDEWRPVNEEAAELANIWCERADQEGVNPAWNRAQYQRYFDISGEVGAEEAITRDHDHCQKIDQVNKQIRAAIFLGARPLVTFGNYWAASVRFVGHRLPQEEKATNLASPSASAPSTASRGSIARRSRRASMHGGFP